MDRVTLKFQVEARKAVAMTLSHDGHQIELVKRKPD
jgi:hypothetical protein